MFLVCCFMLHFALSHIWWKNFQYDLTDIFYIFDGLGKSASCQLLVYPKGLFLYLVKQGRNGACLKSIRHRPAARLVRWLPLRQNFVQLEHKVLVTSVWLTLLGKARSRRSASPEISILFFEKVMIWVTTDEPDSDNIADILIKIKQKK